MNIEIKPIDLGENLNIAFSIRTELLYQAFGKDRSVWPERLRDWTEEIYLQRLSKHIRVNPLFATHVWLEGKIVGQCEMNVHELPQSGYVSLYYIYQEHRGKGIGRQLDIFAMNVFRDMGFKEAYLTVESSNKRGQQFYSSNKWLIVGPNPKYPGGILMRKQISL